MKGCQIQTGLAAHHFSVIASVIRASILVSSAAMLVFLCDSRLNKAAVCDFSILLCLLPPLTL